MLIFSKDSVTVSLQLFRVQNDTDGVRMLYAGGASSLLARKLTCMSGRN
jgi:hypothetical protein